MLKAQSLYIIHVDVTEKVEDKERSRTSIHYCFIEYFFEYLLELPGFPCAPLRLAEKKSTQTQKRFWIGFVWHNLFLSYSSTINNTT